MSTAAADSATPRPRVALNPLPWVLGPAGMRALAGDRLVAVLREVRAAGFGAVMADVPSDLSAADYGTILADCGLRPAAGYFAAAFERTDALPGILEDARRCARQHAELGLTEVFVAGDMLPERLARPAVGARFDEPALAAFTTHLAQAAWAMAAEGVRPCLHPHVGSRVETERETRFVLDHTDPDVLGFGPDTGHLAWGGADPVTLVADYATRVGGVHLKDVHGAVAAAVAEDGASYAEATFGRHLWTEPGRGDVDLLGVVKALPDFTGWWVVEVDVPDRTSPQDSAARSAGWVAEHLPPDEGACL